MTDLLARKTRFSANGHVMQIQETHDVEPVIDDVAEVENRGFFPSHNYRRIGSIPLAVVDQAYREGVNILDGSTDSQKWVKKWLNENTKFRVSGAKF